MNQRPNFKVINVVTRVCNACEHLTSCNRLKPIFEWFVDIFETQQLAAGIAPNSGNHNRKIDRTMIWFSSVLLFFVVLWTESLNTAGAGFLSNHNYPAQVSALHLPSSCATCSFKCTVIPTLGLTYHLI